MPWLSPPENLTLADDQIHIWRASLDVGQEVTQLLTTNLAPDELLRASRFAFARDRDHFVVRRGILRQIASMYLRLTASQITFQYGIHGKPHVRMDQLRSPFHFNLSHSHGVAVYAFSRQREVGIDIEFIRPNFSGEEIAERYFAASELSQLRGLSAKSRPQAFFLGWTRKEAYIKARGSGLQMSLNSFNVSLAPGEPERLNSDDSSRWSLFSFEPAPRFAGAVVGEGQDWQPRYWNWLPPERYRWINRTDYT